MICQPVRQNSSESCTEARCKKVCQKVSISRVLRIYAVLNHANSPKSHAESDPRIHEIAVSCLRFERDPTNRN